MKFFEVKHVLPNLFYNCIFLFFLLYLSVTFIGMNNSVCFQNISTELEHNWVTYLLLCIYTLRSCNSLCRLTVRFISFINALKVLERKWFVALFSGSVA